MLHFVAMKDNMVYVFNYVSFISAEDTPVSVVIS